TAIGREFYDHGKRSSMAHCGSNARDRLGAGAKDGSPLQHIGTGDIYFDAGHPCNAFEDLCQLGKFAAGLSGNIDDDRDLPCLPYRGISLDDYTNTWIL